MALWKPDQTFYPSARMAMQAPREQLGYVVTFNPTASNGKHDALCVLDLDPKSKTYSQVVGRAEVSNAGDELHHFGWNACSAALCPYAPHPHIERRYLLVPGLRSSRIYIFDTKPDPRSPKLVKTIEAEEIASRAGYSRPHTVHCGPDAIYVSALGSPSGDGPGGIFLLDHESFDVLGRWEVDRGPQRFAYDFWWHLGWDVAVTSEWGTPNMIENGVVPELLLGNKYGHAIHIWNLRNRRHLKSLDLGAENQMALELRPSHDPTKTFGFVGVVISTKDLSASIWLWYRDSGDWKVRKVIEIPAEPADESLLPPALKPFKAVPPLITDINLSLDDKFLYVACFGTGDLKQYDVSDPFKPRETGSVRLGGIVSHAKHPKSGPLNGASQMIEAQPRRAAHLHIELAVRRVGCAVLPGGRARLGREDRLRAGGRHDGRSEFLHDLRRRAAASDSSRGRRLVVRFVLLSVTSAWPWIAVAALGAYHGIDPSMGWLFAVALGLQEQRRSKVIWALGPIAAGHLVSIAAVVAIIGGLRLFFAIDYLRPVGAAALILFGLFRFVWPHAHPRWVAMRVNAPELALWSFLMASAHGAGLMLFPILIGMTPSSSPTRIRWPRFAEHLRSDKRQRSCWCIRAR